LSDFELWKLVYHLAGPTLLGITDEESLGSLPVPIRTAVLKTVAEYPGEVIECKLLEESLQFTVGNYEWIDNWRYKNYQIVETSLSPLKLLLQELPKRYPIYQQVVFTLLHQCISSGSSRLVLADYKPTVAAFSLAVLDSVALIEKVAELYGLTLNLPEIDIYLVGSVDEYGVNTLLRHYQGATNYVDSCQTTVRLLTVNELPESVDFTSAGESLNNSLLDNSYTFTQLESFIVPFATEIGEILPLLLQPISTVNRIVLDYFARRYFSVPELKAEQVEMIRKILRNESALGLLPTGFGKSLIFQLYALLVPRITLVISPLRVLIRDQVHSLKRLGFKCVELIIAGETTSQRKAKLSDLYSARYRLLYISPERLQIAELREFSEESAANNQQLPMGALVVDEAHCISELGHDFRPGYLQVVRLQEYLRVASGKQVPIIALTATASEVVIKDILRVLKLTNNSVVELARSKRPELSFSVHVVEKPEDKPGTLVRILQEVIPQALNIPFNELLPRNQNPPFPHTGIIFGMYADSQGRRTFVEGVHNIAYEVKQRLFIDGSLIQVHASRSPDCCPRCGSPVIQNETQKVHKKRREVCRCLECGAIFSPVEKKKFPNWERLIQQRQDDFKDSNFPLLVATRGYRVGIDKRNIRFIIHHSLSSSLETYYQEAGRAGQDNQHAHIALIFHPPHPECQKDYINAGIAVQPPCVANKQNYDFWLCPYYEKHLCDYGHQARLIRKQYPGLAEESSSVVETYKKLLTSQTLVVNGEIKNHQTQIALYRLQQLGIVQDFSLKYIQFSKIEYQVSFNSQWTLEEIGNSLKEVLLQRDISEKYAQAKINKVFIPLVNQNLDNVRELVLTQILHILLERIYEIVLRMRYQMLWNQLEYARCHLETICRRVVLKGIYDNSQDLLAQNQRCEFCDVCNPNLEFDREEAVEFTEDNRVNSIVQQIPLVLEGFDMQILQDVLQFTIEHRAVAGMFARVINRLEREPTNLAALYLGGALARLRYGKAKLAFEYLKFGFQEGIKQGLPADGLLLFYQQAVHLNAEEAFSWLTEVGGAWDNREGFKFLLKEAKQRFGGESSHYRILASLWKIRSLSQVNDDCDYIKPALAILKLGF
jgi:ATP-dependent DNA helicase RecQ